VVRYVSQEAEFLSVEITATHSALKANVSTGLRLESTIRDSPGNRHHCVDTAGRFVSLVIDTI
jgi:hypothetical protein